MMQFARGAASTPSLSLRSARHASLLAEVVSVSEGPHSCTELTHTAAGVAWSASGVLEELMRASSGHLLGDSGKRMNHQC
jgi:hypothetical protein